jgi:hypothetical protein
MLPDIIPSWRPAKWDCTFGSSFMWEDFRQGRRRFAGHEASPDQVETEQRSPGHPYVGGKDAIQETMETESTTSDQGISLFQEVFFFCTIKNVGDVPGAGCIYVETVVDRDTGFAFAKVYSARTAMNAVDILSSRVIPFFDRQGLAIKEIHTRKTCEYCGLIPVHPFETFLSTSHILHLPTDEPGQPCNYLCEQFYRFLLKEFFQPALRKKFQLSLNDLQKDLDTFVDAYNAMQKKHGIETRNGLPSLTNFPVDL